MILWNTLCVFLAYDIHLMSDMFAQHSGKLSVVLCWNISVVSGRLKKRERDCDGNPANMSSVVQFNEPFNA